MGYGAERDYGSLCVYEVLHNSRCVIPNPASRHDVGNRVIGDGHSSSLQDNVVAVNISISSIMIQLVIHRTVNVISLKFPPYCRWISRKSRGTNTVPSLTMYCQGAEDGALLCHSDQYRGLKYSYTEKPDGPGATVYAEPSPDYFQYVDLGGPGLVPVGYGYRSIEHIVKTAIRVNGGDAVRVLEEIDAAGILATPQNSAYNERVIEAARESVRNGGREVRIG